jgi:two-component system sensor histidine kinase YesM
MNEYGSAIVRTEITNSMQSKVHFYNRTLENEFSRIINLMKELTSHDDLDLLSNRSEIMSYDERRVTIKSIQKELAFIKAASNYILTAEVHITAIDRTISQSSFGSIQQNQFQALNQVANIYESPFIYWQDRLFISLPYPIQSNNLKPSFVLDVEISIGKLEEEFRQFTDQSSAGILWINFDNGWQIPASNRLGLTNKADFLQDALKSFQGLKEINLQDENYLFAAEKSRILSTSLLMYEKENTVLGPLRLYRIWFWLISVLSLIVVLFVSFLIYRLIHRPLKVLIRGFRKVEHGDLNVVFHDNRRDEFQYLYKQFNAMVKNLQQMITEVYEQKYRAQHAELRQLQSQINPHFLYNSLFILNRLAKKSKDQVQIDFTKYLSNYFHFMTRNSSSEILLSEEVAHAKNYVDIQTIRFSHLIQVRFDALPFAMASITVPRLILQPIVENAYKYGLEHRESGGKLSVSFGTNEGDAFIYIEDNGQHVDGITVQRLQKMLDEFNLSQETTGLINLHRRIVYRFGSGYGISLTLGAECGLKVTVRLPSDLPTS